MSYEPSGEGGTGVIKKSELESFSRVDDRSGSPLSGYTTLSSSRHIQPTVRPVASDLAGARISSNEIALRDAIRRGLALAKDTADSMEVYSRTGQLMDLSVAGFKLLSILQDLWELREGREDDWVDLLNILQGALANEPFEKFTPDRCDAIRTIVSDHLATGVVDIDDIERTIQLLRNAGLDPWKAISGDPQLHED
jgi:hypothetical protein